MEFVGFTYLKFLMALVFVLGLIAVLAVIAKRFGLGNRGPLRRGKEKRLSVVETMPLDAKRRIVLVRRDDREHLIMLGAAGDLVIESDIAARSVTAPNSPMNPAPQKEPVRSNGK
ncbi:MAG: FliO/MopB family protein [Candidatus Hydrogenedentes bacterium]|nr:FliO/MopB family protein [Candidatus Hydrogenedentota bacterium]